MVLVTLHRVQEGIRHPLGEVVIEHRPVTKRHKPLPEEFLRDLWLFYFLPLDLNTERIRFLSQIRQAVVQLRRERSGLDRL